jgi:hypothetical protein
MNRQNKNGLDRGDNNPRLSEKHIEQKLVKKQRHGVAFVPNWYLQGWMVCRTEWSCCREDSLVLWR